MKKTILALALIATLAACGSSTEKTATDSISVADTAVVDSLATPDTLTGAVDSVFTDVKELKKAE
jgi:ABC-type uncharacterized transport system auxiliary subunit